MATLPTQKIKDQVNFTELLKKHNSTLYQINEFILNAKKLGYGEVEFTIKTHNYINKIVEMKAVKPEKKTLPKSITKRVMIAKKLEKKKEKEYKLVSEHFK